MPTMLSRRSVVLFEIEATEALDAAPDGATNAVLVEQPLRITFNPNVIDTTEVNPSLDPFDPIVGGIGATIEYDLYLKGSGTAGTAPEWAPMLKACGFLETNQAQVGAPEACGAGASTVAATLGATAGTVAQQYRGAPVIFSGTNVLTSTIYDYSGAGKVAKICDTAGAVIAATTQYQIPQSFIYTPVSASISSATIWVYMDGVVYKFVGCRGTCPLTVTSGGAGKISFRFMGMLTSKTDAALPVATYQASRPPIWKGGSFTINSAPAAGQTLSIDPGNNLVQCDNPNATEGFDPAVITARQIRGSVNPKEVLVGTRDVMSAFRAQTKQPLQARFGTTAGNRIAITVPSALYLNQTPGDNNGYQITDVPFHATGLDAGYSIAVF